MRQMTIEELAEHTNISPRTIRYYIAEKILPSPGARGSAARYGDEQLVRLQLIRRLLERHVPLAEMKQLLAGLSLDEARTLLREEEEREQALERAARSLSPQQYISELLRQTRAQQESQRSTSAPPRLLIAQPTQSAQSAQRTSGTPHQVTWQRIELSPDLELHVRADAAPRLQPLIDQLIAIARAQSPSAQ